MAGIRKICKLYGRMTINGVKWVWDYAKDEPVKEADMTKQEWCASEKKKYELLTLNPKQ